MRILILGSNGQLGRELNESLQEFVEVYSYPKEQIDIRDINTLKKILDKISPNIIINAAAYTSVEQAESEKEISYEINAFAVGRIAREVAVRDIFLIHFSTDYVFDGFKKGFYNEEDETRPLNIYGKSKLLGEKLIKESNCKHYIFRTSWIYSGTGKNFVKTIYKLIKTKDEINIVFDQFGVPTSTKLISRILENLIHDSLKQNYWDQGTYHIAPKGKSNWYLIGKKLFDFAKSNNVKTNLNSEDIKPISSINFATKVKRPRNSLLDTKKVQLCIDFDLPKWEDDFYEILQEIIKDNNGEKYD